VEGVTVVRVVVKIVVTWPADLQLKELSAPGSEPATTLNFKRLISRLMT